MWQDRGAAASTQLEEKQNRSYHQLNLLKLQVFICLNKCQELTSKYLQVETDLLLQAAKYRHALKGLLKVRNISSVYWTPTERWRGQKKLRGYRCAWGRALNNIVHKLWLLAKQVSPIFCIYIKQDCNKNDFLQVQNDLHKCQTSFV